MSGTSISDLLAADGLHGHLYSESTTVQQDCRNVGEPCDGGCCPGLRCDTASYTCYCYVC